MAFNLDPSSHARVFYTAAPFGENLDHFLRETKISLRVPCNLTHECFTCELFTLINNCQQETQHAGVRNENVSMTKSVDRKKELDSFRASKTFNWAFFSKSKLCSQATKARNVKIDITNHTIQTSIDLINRLYYSGEKSSLMRTAFASQGRLSQFPNGRSKICFQDQSQQDDECSVK